jgi:hypothetical protein
MMVSPSIPISLPIGRQKETLVNYAFCAFLRLFAAVETLLASVVARDYEVTERYTMAERFISRSLWYSANEMGSDSLPGS